MSDLLVNLSRKEVSERRSVFRRVSELSPEIEEAIRRGFTRVQIVGGLRELGIEISAATLSKYLFRIRHGRQSISSDGPVDSPARRALQARLLMPSDAPLGRTPTHPS